MKLPRIILRKGKEESLSRKHPWIFSGAIYSSEGDPEEGDIVEVFSASGDYLATGHCQIGSISVRVLSFSQENIDADWWLGKVRAAYDVRSAAGLTNNPQTTCYRLVHGEGDGLPGLIIDIYDNTAVVQCHSVGMFLSREQICQALRSLYGNEITAIYDKSSQTVPFNAGLDAVDGYLYREDKTITRTAERKGDEADESHPEPNDADTSAKLTPTQSGIVLENGNRFHVNWERGQKTGFFIDQRENRELVRKYSKGRDVLNTFCYTGGFSVYALAGGAKSVVSVDSSQHAVELAAANIDLNFGADAPHEAIAADAMEYIKGIENKFDMIILDPPAFAKHHKVLGNATQGYKRLNARALSMIKPGGILFTFSCSQAVSRDLFRTTVFTAAAIAGRNVRILHQLTQPADHPVNIYHPEGEYLKGLVLYVE